MRRERVEDLGVICEKLHNVLKDFENRFPWFQSKHAYENFQKEMLVEDCEKLVDLHLAMRYFLECLWEVWAIARGDEEK